MAKQVIYPSLDGFIYMATDEGCDAWVGYSYHDDEDYILNIVLGTAPEGCEPYTSLIGRGFVEFDTSELVPHASIIKKVVLRIKINSTVSAKTRYILVLSSKMADGVDDEDKFDIASSGTLIYSGSMSAGWVEFDLGAAGIAALQAHPLWFSVGLKINETLDGVFGSTNFYSMKTIYKPELHVYWRRRHHGG